MQANREWMLRALAESTIIVVSIILALAVDEWRDDRQNQELAAQSLMIFEQEIRQNLGRVDDAAPYHAGLRDVVAAMTERDGAEAELRSATEGLEPVVLLNTAWETALATGVLTHMEFTIVSALSLTYSRQQRFTDASQWSLPQFSSSTSASPRVLREQIDVARSYLTSLTTILHRLEKEVELYSNLVIELEEHDLKNLDIVVG